MPAYVGVELKAVNASFNRTYSVLSVSCAPNSDKFGPDLRAHLEPLPMQADSILAVVASDDQGQCFSGNYTISPAGKYE